MSKKLFVAIALLLLLSGCTRTMVQNKVFTCPTQEEIQQVMEEDLQCEGWLDPSKPTLLEYLTMWEINKLAYVKCRELVNWWFMTHHDCRDLAKKYSDGR